MSIKKDAAEFGGGRPAGKPTYSADGIKRLLCARAGCSRQAHASWGACADDNMQRPLCPECDVLLNAMALSFMGDPDRATKLVAYVGRVEEEIGRRLERAPAA